MSDEASAKGPQEGVTALSKAGRVFEKLPAWPWLVIAFSPVIAGILTWDTESSSNLAQWWVRLFGAPFLAAELVLIVYALGQGFSPGQALRPAPGWIKLALGALATIAAGDVAFVAPSPAIAAYFALSWMIHLLFGLSAAFLVGRAGSRADIWQVMLAGSIAYAILLVVFVCSIKRPSEFNWRYFGLGVQHVRHAAFFAAVGLAAAIGLSAASPSKRGQFAYLGIGALMFGIIFWSGSRNSIVGIVAAFLVACLLLPSMRRASMAAGFIASGIVGLILSLFHHPPSAYFGINRISDSVQQSSLDSVTSGRFGLWRATWVEAMNRPFFGHGDGQLLAFVRWPGVTLHPHNVLMQAVFSWGLVGLMCFLVLAAFLLSRALGAVRGDEPEQAAPIMVGATLVLMSFNDGTLFFVYPCMMVALSAGTLLLKGERGLVFKP